MERTATIPLDTTAAPAALPPAAPRAFLEFPAPSAAGAPPLRYPLMTGENLVGRDAASVAVLLPDPSVSGAHAVVECLNDGSCFIEDLKSTNKTYLNHDPAADSAAYAEVPPGRRYQLRGGCSLRFGSVGATLHMNRGDVDAPILDAAEAKRAATAMFNHPSTPADDGAATEEEGDDDLPKPQLVEEDDEDDVPIVSKRQTRLNSASSAASVEALSTLEPTIDVDAAPTTPKLHRKALLYASEAAAPKSVDEPAAGHLSAPTPPSAPAGAEEGGVHGVADPPAFKDDTLQLSATADAGSSINDDPVIPPEVPTAAAGATGGDQPSGPAPSRRASHHQAASSSSSGSHVGHEQAPIAGHEDVEEHGTSEEDVKGKGRKTSHARQAPPPAAPVATAASDAAAGSPKRALRGAEASPPKRPKAETSSKPSAKKSRSARLAALTAGGSDDDSAKAKWYFKKDLRLKDEKEGGWMAYSAGDSDYLEKAYLAKAVTLRLNDKYTVNFAEMVQYRNDDAYKQRPVKRVEADS